nr:unnamed protein product [Callosobruchus chinensis]
MHFREGQFDSSVTRP